MNAAPLWIANRQVFEIVRDELDTLRTVYPDLVPPMTELDRRMTDLIAIASAGLLEAVALIILAGQPPEGETLPYVIEGALYRLSTAPPPVPLVEPRLPRRVVQQGSFQFLFHPSRWFQQLEPEERQRWLREGGQSWQPHTGPVGLLVRPFRIARHWPLADGATLIKETSSVAGR